MKLSNELRNLPVVSIAEGEEVGVVKDFIVDPGAKAIVAIIIEDPLWYEGAKVISFSLIHSIGDFALTTENASSVVPLTNMPELASLIKLNTSIIGAKVITRGGRLIGFIKEYSIDSHTGGLLGLELSSDSDIVSPDRSVIPISSIVTIGKDVIIVNEDIEANLTASHDELTSAGAAPPSTRPRPATAPRPRPPAIEEPLDIDIPSGEPEPFAPAAEPEPAEEGVGIDAETEVDLESLLDIEETGEFETERPAPAADTAAAETKESLSEIFERRQIKYMLGKKVSRDIEADDGTTIIKAGEVISDGTIAKAKSAGKFLELSMNIEIEE
ncbi:MAG: PRC-barrel domain-containing protein [bacterium]